MNQLGLWQESEAEAQQIPEPEQIRGRLGVEVGQIWVLDSGGGVVHRVAVGDCRDEALLGRLFQGQKKKASLALLDIPYGMGKEKDGVENDNLYGEKSDAFVMECWQAGRPYFQDNASAYVFGNAESLWRLWYVGGLKDSERLTFRNEIVWDKGSGQGSNSDRHRMYATATERCLFFMLGEQEWRGEDATSPNAANYWEGWNPIRLYLRGEREKMNWSNKNVADIFGFHSRMASHWFDKSQWSLMKVSQYQELQTIANGQAFTKDYLELKGLYDTLKVRYDTEHRPLISLEVSLEAAKFYAARATFNNIHEIMTDVWNFNSPKNSNRYFVATPKPPALMMRIVKSSSNKGDAIYSPFLGSGTDIVACHQTGRSCYGVEVLPVWAAVSLWRWQQLSGGEAVLESESE